MSAAAQLPLDLAWRPAMGASDFLAAPSNAVALAWIDRWPAWPHPALVLHGPPGAGKTHLIQVWRARGGAQLVSGAGLAPEDVPGLVGTGWAVAVDDADAVAARPARERALFHLLNLARERGASVLLAARRAPSRWGVALPDLASRLNAAPAAALEPPDDALLGALLFKLFADRGLAVGGDVVSYLLARMERSADAARRLVAAIDREALAAGRPVTLPLARAALGRMTED